MRFVLLAAPPGCGGSGGAQTPEPGRPDDRVRPGEQVRELGGELVGAVAAHRVPGDRGPIRVEPVAARDVGPDLERVGAGVAVVPAVRPAALGRDHDRARAPLAELRLVAGVRELVVVGAERVQKQGEAVATRRAVASRARRSRTAGAGLAARPGSRWPGRRWARSRAPCWSRSGSPGSGPSGPDVGTPSGFPRMSSVTPRSSLPKSTWAWNGVRSPLASAVALLRGPATRRGR